MPERAKYYTQEGDKDVPFNQEGIHANTKEQSLVSFFDNWNHFRRATFTINIHQICRHFEFMHKSQRVFKFQSRICHNCSLWHKRTLPIGIRTYICFEIYKALRNFSRHSLNLKISFFFEFKMVAEGLLGTAGLQSLQVAAWLSRSVQSRRTCLEWARLL